MKNFDQSYDESAEYSTWVPPTGKLALCLRKDKPTLFKINVGMELLILIRNLDTELQIKLIKM